MKRMKRVVHDPVPLTPQEDLSYDVALKPSTLDKDIFRQFFEARFEPLEQQTQSSQATDGKPSIAENGHIPSSSSSDWDGFSDSDSQISVEVVDHTEPVDFENGIDNGPSPGDSLNSQNDPNTDQRPEDKTETLNLKHDLALQRLLKESHLLDHSAGPTPEGSKRHQATDIRLQALGSKASIYSQEKMPMAHRQGIRAKVAAREAARRKEAKENGITLEREAPTTKPKPIRRERTVGDPGVGKFSGATLILSDRDVRSIQGGRRNVTRRKRGRK